LNSTFTFDQAREIIDYLADLGIGACYVSPILKARPGSLHGYDVIDHSVINPEIGSMEAFERFAARLQEFGMGLVLDIVPNHMCVADLTNSQWFDVLENGPSSPQARFFDIDWNPPREDLSNKVLLPTLGDQYGRVLENQQIRIEYSAGSFQARCYETALPIAPRSWPLILLPVLEYVRPRLGESDPAVLELESITTALGYLPLQTETDQQRIRERLREKEIIKRRLSTLTTGSAVLADGIQAALNDLNGIAGDPASFDRLERLLAAQAYRLSFWRVAADEINYRRFFDINELAAIRTEDPLVFQTTHSLIFELIQKGWITGLRVDHPDGLFNPGQYFADLQNACRPATGVASGRFFVVAEKIVTRDEELRENWAIEGTIGYGYLNQLNGLFVDPGNKRAFRGLYERWIGRETSFPELLYDCKRLILRASMSSELNVLARKLDRICQRHRHSRDFTLESLRFALREVISYFPVYRTYIEESQLEPTEEDRRHIEKAVEEAKRRNAATSESVFDVIGSVLLVRDPDGLTPEQLAERRLFVMRFQQLTGPVMAKGAEDTAFYRYYPLASLNEVGGDPDTFGFTPEKFHRKNLLRLRRWPRALLATSTHDTKRSEDVRARINVLSEIPVKWYEAIRRWNHINQAKKGTVDGVETPDRNAEYLLYQTLVGAWPFQGRRDPDYAGFVQRIQAYMDKALKEAKVNTSWINPNEEYDRAVRGFIEAVLDPIAQNTFLDDFVEFVSSIATAGMYNSLSQVLLKIASPGTPDFFQGSESWNFSLVDPDNRRPVDFHKRRTDMTAILDRHTESLADLVADLLRTPQDGRIKMYVTMCALRYRRSHPDLFETGSYHPIDARGTRKQHIVAFARKLNKRSVLIAAGRFFLGLKVQARLPIGRDAWEETFLPIPQGLLATTYKDILSGTSLAPEQRRKTWQLPLAEVFAHLPVALVEADA
jgi:(1->4)-alpha-D-glucan 1-alpha-D-glucosylmutase